MIFEINTCKKNLRYKIIDYLLYQLQPTILLKGADGTVKKTERQVGKRWTHHKQIILCRAWQAVTHGSKYEKKICIYDRGHFCT